jgi:hypothetical protein
MQVAASKPEFSTGHPHQLNGSDMKTKYVGDLTPDELDAKLIEALPDWDWPDDQPSPSTSWADCGPLIARYEIGLNPLHVNESRNPSDNWTASMPWRPASRAVYCNAASPLLAVARCLVANLVGEKFDVDAPPRVDAPNVETFVGHSIMLGGWCVYAQTENAEYDVLRGPFPIREEADAALALILDQ